MARKPKTLAEQHGIIKHPNVLNDSIVVNPKVTKRAVGLDFGTKTGFAYREYLPDELPKMGPLHLGQFDLQVGDWETTVMKFVRVKQFLNVMMPDVIFFEDVKQEVSKNKMFMMGGIIRSVEMLGALKATVCVWAEEHDVPAHGYTIGAIKKFATGSGAANKVKMIEACNAKFGSELSVEGYENTGHDNMADAAHVLDMGMTTYCEGLQ